jgi:hypothetical protein
MQTLRIGTIKHSLVDQLGPLSDPDISSHVSGDALMVTQQGTLIACIVPQPFYFGDGPALNWSPAFVWIRPNSIEMELRPTMLNICEQLAVDAGQCVLRLQKKNNDFWLTQGFITNENMVRASAEICRLYEFDSGPKSNTIMGTWFWKVMVFDTQWSKTQELHDILAVHGATLCQPTYSEDFPVGSLNTEVAACVTVFNWCEGASLRSIGILEHAVFDHGVLKFKRTVCVPIHKHGTQFFVAIYVMPNSRTDPTQLTRPTLAHISSLVRENVVEGLLFINQVKISQICGMRYPGAFGVCVNEFEAWSQHFQIVNHKPPNIATLQTLFPSVISLIISEYVAQYLPPLHENTKYWKYWETDFQPLLN